MDYVHNLMDYNDPVYRSTDPKDVPEFRSIYFKRCICPDESAYYKIKALEGYPDSIHDVYFEECLLGEQKYDGR